MENKTAMLCKGGLYRVDGDNGFEVFDSLDELKEKYAIVGYLAGIVPQAIVTPK